MTQKRLILGFAWVSAVLISIQQSDAATRSVQFSGISGVQAVTTEGQERADRALCLVQVMNVGTSKQILESARFQGTKSGSGSLIPQNAMAAPDFCIHASQYGKTVKNPTACPNDESGKSSGTPIVLSEGDIFYLGRTLDPLVATEFIHNCTGVIRVSDADPKSRGSVIASGVLSSRQEVRLLDGVMSAAFYASGNHFMGGTTAALAGTTEFPDAVLSEIKRNGALLSSGSMNLGCVSACADMQYPLNFCRLQCGEVSSLSHNPYPEAGSRLSAADQGNILLTRFYATSAQGVLAQVPLSAYAEPNGKVPLGSQMFPAENLLVKMPAYSGIRYNSAQDSSPSCFSFFPDGQAGFAYSVHAPNDQLGNFSAQSGMPNRCRFPRREITPILRLFNDRPDLNLQLGGISSERMLLPFQPGGAQSTTADRDRHVYDSISSDPTRATGLISPEYVSTGAKGTYEPTGSSALNPSSAVLATNPHFAGGMVYEMTLGPMRSICTAQLAARKAGGRAPSHMGALADHETAGETEPSKLLDQERLYCSHRHGLGDLVFSVGDSTSILINGGRPF